MQAFPEQIDSKPGKGDVKAIGRLPSRQIYAKALSSTFQLAFTKGCR